MMIYCNCRIVESKIEDAGHDKVGLPGLETEPDPFDPAILRTMAETFVSINVDV